MRGFIASILLIAAAEMGDKTQLLALSLATRYKATKVLIGITLATLLVHLLSVFIGSAFSRLIPMNYLQLAVGISFIGFGAWTLRGDKDDGDKGEGSRFGAIATVAIAFFLAELGDKTQLATISLAAKYDSFFGVWIGSTLGMVIADSLAILVGVVAGQRLPEKAIKIVSAIIFILFGLITIGQALF